jgi:hypothetical protein
MKRNKINQGNFVGAYMSAIRQIDGYNRNTNRHI